MPKDKEGPGQAPSYPPGRSFLLMTTWHLIHFFILRAHSARGSECIVSRAGLGSWATQVLPTHPELTLTHCAVLTR